MQHAILATTSFTLVKFTRTTNFAPVIWSIQHFWAYLYGQFVMVVTDHSEVRAALETPSPSGKHTSITELEMLAVVCSIQHFWAYLYGQLVMVVTDHSAVRTVLETPSPSGKPESGG